MKLVMKTCATCHEYKPQHFGRSARNRDGMKGTCNACTGDYYRAWKARCVAAHSQWLGERGLAARSPGTITPQRGAAGNAGRRRR